MQALGDAREAARSRLATTDPQGCRRGRSRDSRRDRLTLAYNGWDALGVAGGRLARHTLAFWEASAEIRATSVGVRLSPSPRCERTRRRARSGISARDRSQPACALTSTGPRESQVLSRGTARAVASVALASGRPWSKAPNPEAKRGVRSARKQAQGGTRFRRPSGVDRASAGRSDRIRGNAIVRERPRVQYVVSSVMSVIDGPNIGRNRSKTPASRSCARTARASSAEGYSTAK